MSETGTVVDITQRIEQSRHDRIHISDSALWAAIAYIHEVAAVSLSADEREFAAQWQEEENAMIAALSGHGLERYIKKQ